VLHAFSKSTFFHRRSAIWRLATDRNSQNASDSTPTTIQSYQNIYAYHPKNLYLAYGLAISFSLICVALGCLALWQNGGKCYTNSFSTLLRTTRGEEFDQLVTDAESDGRDPLSDEIGKARVALLGTNITAGGTRKGFSLWSGKPSYSRVKLAG
jgi:hypothetical protein